MASFTIPEDYNPPSGTKEGQEFTDVVTMKMEKGEIHIVAIGEDKTPIESKSEKKDEKPVSTIEVIQQEKLTELINQPIEVLQLSSRPVNCLKNAQVKLISDLVKKSDDELKLIKNMGQKSIDEIKTSGVKVQRVNDYEHAYRIAKRRLGF